MALFSLGTVGLLSLAPTGVRASDTNNGNVNPIASNSVDNDQTVRPSMTGQSAVSQGTGTGSTDNETSPRLTSQKDSSSDSLPSSDQTTANQPARHQWNSGWNKVDNSWYYYNSNSQRLVNGWQKINGRWYNFGQTTGAAKTGSQRILGMDYYFDPQNAWAVTGWSLQNNNWYYYDPANAWKLTGWRFINGHWYYLDPVQGGATATGLQTIDGKQYYLNSHTNGTFGAMQNGWAKVDGSWYFFAGNGTAEQGWQKINGRWYNFDQATGAAKTGSQRILGMGYYFDPQNAWAVTGWSCHDGAWYYYDPVNVWALAGWQKLNGRWYNFDQVTGAAKTGNQRLLGMNYYFDPQNAWATTGWLYHDGAWYYYDPRNAWAVTGWNNIGEKTYYFILSGKMVTGKQLIDNHDYYFDHDGHQLKQTGFNSDGVLIAVNKDNGSLVINQHLQNGGQEITIDSDGAVTIEGNGVVNLYGVCFDYQNGAFQTGWVKHNNKWYYFDSRSAVAVIGWQFIGGRWYCFNYDGTAKTGWNYLDNNWYYMDDKNAWCLTGWQFINNAWYYMNLTKAWAYRGYHQINGIDYYFEPNKAWLYQNRWVNVNGWVYHADNSGRLWFPQWYTQFPIAEGCSVATLAMMLSPKRYINWSYAMSLLQQRQAGDIYTGAGFYQVIQPASLVELAHHFDSSVRNISGTSVQGIIETVLAGHPVEYWGYSRYETYYVAHNHCKLIVGYQNGWFEVYDPCYNYASQGSTGWNSFDYGAKAWISTAQFAREYVGSAITVD